MKRLITFATVLVGMALPAHAESSIQYYGDAGKRHDRKIEQAAIEIAASKVGELRGSIEGIDADILMTARDLDSEQSSKLGFPVIR